MSTTTPSFGWPVPTSGDLVKNGATAIEALGDAIDSSMTDLKGGTTGQVLSKTSNTDMDFTWVAADDTNAIQNSIVDAKGDLIAATAADTPARLAVGATNKLSLQVDSTASTGLAWQQQGVTLIQRTAFTSVTSQSFTNVFDESKYYAYIVNIDEMGGTVSTADPLITYINSSGEVTTSYYGFLYGGSYSSSSMITIPVNNAANVQIARNLSISSFFFVNNTNGSMSWSGTTGDIASAESFTGSFYNGNAYTYTGFKITPSSGNISGVVSIYGLAKE